MIIFRSTLHSPEVFYFDTNSYLPKLTMTPSSSLFSGLHDLMVAPDQSRINARQASWMKDFIDLNPDAYVKAYILCECTDDKQKKLWAQLMIFLALACIVPKEKHLSCPPQIDTLWHRFILCTGAYADFCEDAGVNFIHHTPEEVFNLPPGRTSTPWTGITEFLDNRIPGYDERYWDGSTACSTD
jgi:hypothetical protein